MGHVIALVGISFLVGAVPLISLIFFLLTGQSLTRLGTGNASVSAAFYHGGTVVGILAVLSEALKGISVVLLAQAWFAGVPALQLVALCCLVIGRFTVGKGAGTTNTVWGIVTYNWRVAFFLLLVSGGFFLFDRDRQRNKYLVLFLLPLIIAILVQELWQTLTAMALGGILAMIYARIKDDLDLNGQEAKNQAMFHFLKGRQPNNSLDQVLQADEVGAKAANLSLLKRQGYNVPPGWVIKAGDDPIQFAQKFQPSSDFPLVARSSAIGEDSLHSSAAGQYDTVLNITSTPMLVRAIARCQDSFENLAAIEYRQKYDIQNASMSVLVQPQIQGIYSGVAFSRDPLESWLDQVVIEGVAGHGQLLVSGQTTPAQFRVAFKQSSSPTEQDVRGDRHDIPQALILEIAQLTRRIEKTFQGIPQDIEWTYDGQQLWILQARPITTLQPIWTRKIAAEVIPGLIHPLTWSINQPLTCGVWGDLFSLVLGPAQSQDLAFQNTAQLHFGRAYFNASLLRDIFVRMGLPPESLEFLTQGAAMSRPQGLAVFKALPGLVRLIQQELKLDKAFSTKRSSLDELLAALEDQPAHQSSLPELKQRVHNILQALEVATYFQIMAPLSYALRQKLLGIEEAQVNTGILPEIGAMNAIAQLATQIPGAIAPTPEAVLHYLQTDPSIQSQWAAFLSQYGYLSEVATDISVPTWQEEPQIVAQSIQIFRGQQPRERANSARLKSPARLTLKGEVAQIYNRLLAQLRWTFVALEHHWIQQNVLQQKGDIFFLTWPEIEDCLERSAPNPQSFQQLLAQRKADFQALAELESVPAVVYGKTPTVLPSAVTIPCDETATILEGIGASSGQVEGQITLVKSLQALPAHIGADNILVVPFTDAGWAPLFAQAGGIISEVGGRLSHGAILAREYGIPAVMDVPGAFTRLKEGQRVRLNGLTGRIEVLS